MSSTKVFFYGLFMDSDLLRDQGLDPQQTVKAKLLDYKLVLANRATMLPSPGSTVWGTLIALNDAELTQLYSAPSVTGYQAIDIICNNEQNEEIRAKTYILPNDYQLLAPDNTNYAKNLRNICIKHALPDSYIRFLNNLINKMENKQ